MAKHPRTRSVLLLAGGMSSRMGVPKGLLNYSDRPWLTEQLRRLRVSGVTQTILVLGYRSAEYFAELPELETTLGSNIKFQGMLLSTEVNDLPQFGPFSSIIKGLKAFHSLKPFNPNVFILPIDVPCPEPRVWEALERALLSGMEASLPSFQGKGGHPVLLSRTLQEKLFKIPLESTLARLDLQLQSIDQTCIQYVPVLDQQVQINFNTLADWNSFRENSP